MSEMALEHRDHNLSWDQRTTRFKKTNQIFGSFLHCYCEDCNQELGNLNITNILDQMELGD